MISISQADSSHIDRLADLFNMYRQFYECPPDRELAHAFISQRIAQNESIIFIAEDESQALGFVQLYPSFCSVEAIKIFILYDLFVADSARRKGVGRKLMDQATTFSSENGAGRIDLLTAHSNHPGQRLYESLGYEKVLQDFHAYSLNL